MSCISDDSSFFGYIDALWCTVKSEFFSTYTPLLICSAMLTGAWVLLWIFRTRDKKSSALNKSVSSLKEAAFILFGSVLLYAIFVAPYKLYANLTQSNESLGQIKNDALIREKKEIITKLLDLLREGRDLESLAQFSTPSHPSLQVDLNIWNSHKEQLELFLLGSRYRSYATWLKDENEKSFKTQMHKIREIVEKIQNEEIVNH